MPKLSHVLPKYRRHKKSGQAIVTLSGKDHYLGPWKSAASKAEYRRLTGLFQTAGGTLKLDRKDELTVVELVTAYMRHARTFYRDADGLPTSELADYKTLAKRLGKAYGRTLVADFGPLVMKAFRATMVAEQDNDGGQQLARTTINHAINRLRHIWKWGVENELIEPQKHEALKRVASLLYGKCDARETEPVKPVKDAFVNAVLPCVSPQVAAMIELQRITGMRSGEVCRLRGCDLNTSGSVWEYTPAKHKTQYRGHVRTIYLGPQAQVLLKPWLRTDLRKYLFSPAEAEAWRREQRKTPLSCGNKPGSNKKAKPKRSPGDQYTVNGYLRAVKYGIAKCNRERCKQELPEIPSWHPHQLRHNAATEFRRQHGLEVARVLLGHKHAAITETYAEADRARAVEVVAKIG